MFAGLGDLRIVARRPEAAAEPRQHAIAQESGAVRYPSAVPHGIVRGMEHETECSPT